MQKEIKNEKRKKKSRIKDQRSKRRNVNVNEGEVLILCSMSSRSPMGFREFELEQLVPSVR